MSTKQQKYNEHQIHQILFKLDALAEGPTPAIKDENILEQYNRIILTIKSVKKFLAMINPELLPFTLLDSAVQPLSQLHVQLDAFFKSGNAANLQNASNNNDTLIQIFPVFALPQVSSYQPEALNKYIETANSFVSSLSKETNSTSQKLSQIKSESDAFQAKVANLEQVIESQKGRLDNAIATYQKQFSEAEVKRHQEILTTDKNFNMQFQQFKDKINADINATLENQKSTMDKLSLDFKSKADNILKEMVNKKDAAAELLNVSTNVAVSGSYVKCAQREKIGAEVFRGIALAFMILLIYGAVLTVKAVIAQGIHWELIAVRLVTTFTLAIPAFYAVKESNKHRIVEYRYQKMQLELAAIDPYLQFLEKPQRDDIKKKLSEKFFAQPEVNDDITNVNAGSLLDIIKQILITLAKK